MSFKAFMITTQSNLNSRFYADFTRICLCTNITSVLAPKVSLMKLPFHSFSHIFIALMISYKLLITKTQLQQSFLFCLFSSSTHQRLAVTHKAFHLIDKHSFDDKLFNNLLNDSNKNAINNTRACVGYA
jgi:hypothetical protein